MVSGNYDTVTDRPSRGCTLTRYFAGHRTGGSPCEPGLTRGIPGIQGSLGVRPVVRQGPADRCPMVKFGPGSFVLCLLPCRIKWQHSTLRSDETTNPHSREWHTSYYRSSRYCNMSPAGIMDATIPIAFSVSSTMPTPTPSHETHVYHRGGIRGKVESLIYGT